MLLADDCDASFTSSAQDSLLVVIRTDEGIDGYGESDLNPWIGKVCIEAPETHTVGLSMKEILIGADASDICGIWGRIYTATAIMDGAKLLSMRWALSRWPFGTLLVRPWASCCARFSQHSAKRL